MSEQKTVKLLLSGIVAGSVLVGGYYTFGRQPESRRTQPQQTQQSSAQTVQSHASSENTTSISGEVVGQYADGVYTGAVVTTHRGDFQLQVTIAGGKITEIIVLQHPTHGPSVEINERSLPLYTAEALEKQSSDLTLVTGASATFEGFTGSLQDALNQASN